MKNAWLRFFRVVNLPTVPGDVLVGAAIGFASAPEPRAGSVVAASLAAVFLYMFGLADNDLVGARTDRGRPIPDGEISPRAAALARGLCLFAALVTGAVMDLPPLWWCAAAALCACIVVYNRLKSSLLMGLCRGLNVACGAFAVAAMSDCGVLFRATLGLACTVWTAYIGGVTAYSAGEENDPVKKRRVGFLIGSLVYLQILALLALYLVFDGLVNFLLAGAVLLVVLRFFKRLFPRVSAS